MSRLVEFEIPAEFITCRVVATSPELRYGFEHGWIREADVVKVALAGVASGSRCALGQEELGYLLKNDLERVPELLAELAPDDKIVATSTEVWVYLALAWIFENRKKFSNPLEIVDLLFADFEYPGDMHTFVSFMPAPPGERLGRSHVTDRWQLYLDMKGQYFRDRTCGSAL